MTVVDYIFGSFEQITNVLFFSSCVWHSLGKMLLIKDHFLEDQ